MIYIIPYNSSINSQKMVHISIVLFLTLLSYSTQQIVSSACIQFSSSVCIRCSLDTHIFESLCYQNIIGCLQYKQGATCIDCDQSISRLVNGNCVLIQNQGPLSKQLKNRIYEYGNPGNRYGEKNFIPTTYDEVKNWETFMIVNKDIRTGQYSHFITKGGNPVYSIHYRVSDNNEKYSYKILYEGSGGGIFLLIADISSQTMTSKIRSFVPIALTYIVDHCIDYDTRQFSCILCDSGYHLENGNCYRNTGNCIRYNQNICLQCVPYHLLVENKCIADCFSLSDSQSILYYRGQNICSLQKLTDRTISSFYSITSTSIRFTQQLRDTNININSSSNTKITSTNSSSSREFFSSSSQTRVVSNNIPGASNLSSLNIVGERDPNCAQYSIDKLSCVKCANFFFSQNGICKQVSPYCQTYNQTNGECTSCFGGYKLKNGVCSI